MVGKPYFFSVLGTLNPDSKSLGHSIFFTFVHSCSHSVPLLLICMLVFSYQMRNCISHPKGDTCNNVKAASICLSVSPCRMEWGTETTLTRFVDDTEIVAYQSVDQQIQD